MPKATQKTSSTEAVAKEVIEIEDEPQEDTGGHRVVNPIEGRHHIQLLDEAMQALEAKTKTGEIKNVLKDALEEVYKDCQQHCTIYKRGEYSGCIEIYKRPNMPRTARRIGAC